MALETIPPVQDSAKEIVNFFLIKILTTFSASGSRDLCSYKKEYHYQDNNRINAGKDIIKHYT